MAWGENKKLKINLLRENPRGHDLSIVFTITDAKKTEFQRVLNTYLEACKKLGAYFSEAIERIDGETGEVCFLELQIRASPANGGQGMLVQEIHKLSDHFIRTTEWSQ